MSELAVRRAAFAGALALEPQTVFIEFFYIFLLRHLWAFCNIWIKIFEQRPEVQFFEMCFGPNKCEPF